MWEENAKPAGEAEPLLPHCSVQLWDLQCRAQRDAPSWFLRNVCEDRGIWEDGDPAPPLVRGFASPGRADSPPSRSVLARGDGRAVRVLGRQLGSQATTPPKSCVGWGKPFNLNNPQRLL